MRRRLPALASLLAALALVIAGRTARADLVVGYDAIDVFPLVTKSLAPINGAGVTGSVLSTFALANRTGGGVNYTWSGFPTGAPAYGQGFNFAFTSATPYDLSTLELQAVRTAVGPMMLELFVDVGSGFVSMGTNAVPTAAATLSYNLAMTNVTSAAFQLRGYNAGNSGSMATFSLMDSGNLDGTADLVVFGTVAVPEASPFLFGGALCGVLGLWRLRQNRCLAEGRI